MALKLYTILAHLGKVRQTHYLITAAVGQDWPVPIHELVQSAQLRHPLSTGTEHQVIGVAKDNIGTRCAHILRLHSLYGRCCSNRHESRSADFTALHSDFSRPCLAVSRSDRERKTVGHENLFQSESKIKRGFSGQWQAGITIAIKPIALGNRMGVGALHYIQPH